MSAVIRTTESRTARVAVKDGERVTLRHLRELLADADALELPETVALEFDHAPVSEVARALGAKPERQVSAVYMAQGYPPREVEPDHNGVELA